MPRKREKRSQYVDYGGKTDKYEWDQYEDELVVWIKVGEGTKGKDLDIVIKPDHLKVGLKGKPPIIDGPLVDKIITDESTWTVDNGVVELTLQKAESSAIWWKGVIQGDPEIDVKKIEGSKYLDDSLLKKIKEKDEEEKRKKEQEAEEKRKKEQEAAAATTGQEEQKTGEKSE